MSLERNIRSTGIAFLRKNIIFIKDNFDQIINNKESYVQHLFDHQDGWFDSKPSGTLIRVNSALRIIREGNYDEALMMISKTKNKEYDFTV